MDSNRVKEVSEILIENISKVIIGKKNVIELLLTAFFADGHILLDDVPGVGKTLVSKSLAKSVKCEFKRIQFTPDLLPTDLTGINFYSQKNQDFIFRQGPIFANIILADEINRATPRTQSSLLECMEESQVTIDGETRNLEKPFLVVATQNPIENHGTFPLPEAQLDRFMIRIKIGYPSKKDGRIILDVMEKGHSFDTVNSVIEKDEIVEIQNYIKKVVVSPDIKNYIMDIIEKTRNNDKILLGISPRGSIALMRSAQAYAAIKGRYYVIPDDVKQLVKAVLAHRLILKDNLIDDRIENMEEVLDEILDNTKTPIEDNGTIKK